MKASIINSGLVGERSGWVLLSPLRLMMLFMLFAASGYGANTNYYVWRDNPGPSWPFTNWAMAATSIQDAVDCTLAGDTVYVTNGIYDNGGKVTPSNLLTNRVCITEAITLKSMNGPAVTIIKGAEAPTGGTGTGAVRCVYMVSGASLIGFTITNGHNQPRVFPEVTSDYHFNACGGGVFLNSGGVVSNCLITGNASATEGGGVHFYSVGGIVNNCIISGNTTVGSGGGMSCTSGGTLNNCILSGNSANSGGGACIGAGFKLINCLVSGNTAMNRTGVRNVGLEASISNCTVTGNTATDGETGGIDFSAGYAGGTINNCIVWGNSASIGAQNISTNSATTVNYTCSSPQPDGAGNTGLDPLFVDTNAANYRLRVNSPCVNRGTNADWMLNAVDLDGKRRICYETVDLGAYEMICAGAIFSVR